MTWLYGFMLGLRTSLVQLDKPVSFFLFFSFFLGGGGGGGGGGVVWLGDVV
jgi:hypothetical protein